MPRSPQEVYARLLSSQRGYPLWTPEPSHELLMQRRDGFRIGDVGFVTDDGGFDVLFNICLPNDHPFHRPHGVPQGFTYIDESRLDIRTIPNAECQGGVISTPSVTRVETSNLSGDDTRRQGSSALSYRFILSPSEGALLILPKGAERRDLLDEGVFLAQACRHGAEWYNYTVNRRHRIISHDSLYLLTGLSKTRSWSVAAFDHVPGNGPDMPAHFKHIGGDIAASSYVWETARPLDWRAGPHIDHDIPNQTVFIRGFKIAIRRRLLGSRRISVEADVPSTRYNPNQSPSIISGSRLVDAFAGLGLGRTGGTSRIPRVPMRHNGNESTHSTGSTTFVPRDDSKRIEIQRVPDTPPTFHPSLAINKYLLRKYPSANVAITHDGDWVTILESTLTSQDPLTPEQLEREAVLEKVLSQHFHTVVRDGVVYLKKNSLQQAKVPQKISNDPTATSGASNVTPGEPSINLVKEPLQTFKNKPETKPHPCQWTYHRRRCGTWVSERELPAHLRTVHRLEFSENRTLECCWGNCGEKLQGSLGHVLEHIRVRHTRNSTWDCPHCTVSFVSGSTLQLHLQVTHMEESQGGTGHTLEPQLIRGRGPKYDTWGCPGCDRIFDSKSATQQHFKAIHMPGPQGSVSNANRSRHKEPSRTRSRSFQSVASISTPSTLLPLSPLQHIRT